MIDKSKISLCIIQENIKQLFGQKRKNKTSIQHKNSLINDDKIKQRL